MKVEILTVCDSAAASGNKLSIIGASETFHSENPKSLLGDCFLVYRLRFEPGEQGRHTLKIVISDEDGKEVKQFSNSNISADTRNDAGFIPNIGIIPLKGILIPKFGEFSVTLFGDNERLASIPIYFLRATAPE